MWGNTDQKDSEYGHTFCNVCSQSCYSVVLAHFIGKYQQYTFVVTTVNNCKCKFQQKEPGEPQEKFKRPSLFEDNILVKIKGAIIRLPLVVNTVLRK